MEKYKLGFMNPFQFSIMMLMMIESKFLYISKFVLGGKSDILPNFTVKIRT